MSSPLSDTYPVAGYMSQLSHTSIPPLQQNDDNMLPALRGGTDCLTLTVKMIHVFITESIGRVGNIR